METGEVWKYHMWLRVYRTERSFGPGVSTLMRLVEEEGSPLATCKEMGMAYPKTWKIVKAAEAGLGFALMEGSSGGESNGKTVPMEKGEDFLEWYLRFEAEVQQKADEVFKRYFGAREDRKQGISLQLKIVIERLGSPQVRTVS